MYQEQVPSYKHLDEPLDMLDEGRFVFECILAGNLQAFTTLVSRARPSHGYGGGSGHTHIV